MSAAAPTTTIDLHAAVAAHVRAFLATLETTPGFRAAIAATLSVPGNMLAPRADARWAGCVWTCRAAAGGTPEQAVPVAAAVELYMIAADLLDDVQDGETHPVQDVLGLPRLLNVATGLLLGAQQVLLVLPGGATAVAMLLAAGIHACGGQHDDLAPPEDRRTDLGASLAIARAKSAALVAVCCRLGAWTAGADEETQVRFARFGAHVGMVAQLSNDLRALRPDAHGKTDRALNRPTLPLTYAALEGVDRPGDAGHCMDEAIVLTWTAAETYRRYAQACVPWLTDDRIHQAALRALIEPAPPVVAAV